MLAILELALQETQNMAFIRHKSSKLIISLKSRYLFLFDALAFVFRLQGWKVQTRPGKEMGGKDGKKA